MGGSGNTSGQGGQSGGSDYVPTSCDDIPTIKGCCANGDWYQCTFEGLISAKCDPKFPCSWNPEFADYECYSAGIPEDPSGEFPSKCAKK